MSTFAARRYRREALPLHVCVTVLTVLLLAGCGGGGGVMTAVMKSAASAKAVPAEGNRLRPGAGETLLIGTSSRTILQVQPRSGRLIAALQVGTDPAHIAADDRNIFFGGFPLVRYEIASGQMFNFAFSDAYTNAQAMAVTAAGMLFASNLYTFAPDTACGTCSSVVAYPDPNNQNPTGAVNYVYGYVSDPSTGNARLSGQQIGFTQSGNLLVVSSTGYGVYQSNLQIDQGTLSFTQLVRDPSYSTTRIATDGQRHLFVLHAAGIDEDDLTTGAFEKPFLSVTLNHAIDMTISPGGSVYVLEQDGTIKGFSSRGRQIARFTAPAAMGQPLTIGFCCRSRPQVDAEDQSDLPEDSEGG
jgi:hypothetical protein